MAGHHQFMMAGCMACHNGPYIGGQAFQKLGAKKAKLYFEMRTRFQQQGDHGGQQRRDHKRHADTDPGYRAAEFVTQGRHRRQADQDVLGQRQIDLEILGDEDRGDGRIDGPAPVHLHIGAQRHGEGGVGAQGCRHLARARRGRRPVHRRRISDETGQSSHAPPAAAAAE